jgi:hypothetical protein
VSDCMVYLDPKFLIFYFDVGSVRVNNTIRNNQHNQIQLQKVNYFDFFFVSKCSNILNSRTWA